MQTLSLLITDILRSRFTESNGGEEAESRMLSQERRREVRTCKISTTANDLAVSLYPSTCKQHSSVVGL